MGKTRTALVNYVKYLVVNQKLFEELEEKTRSLGKDELPHLSEYLKNGVDVLLLHLAAELKKKGSSLKNSQKMQLKDLMDPTVTACIKEIKSTGNLLKQKSQVGTQSLSKTLDEIRRVLDLAEQSSAVIKVSVKKKERSLLATKEKKAKYVYYLDLVQWIEEEVELQRQSVKEINKKYNSLGIKQVEKLVDNFCSIDGSWTIDDVQSKADKELSTAISNYEDGSEEMGNEVRKIRSELKKAGPQIKRLELMAKEADEFDKVI